MTIESIAKLATEYALKHVKDIPTSPANNELSCEAQAELERRLENRRETARKKCLDPFINIDPCNMVLDLDTNLASTKQERIGSCGELTRLALEYVSDHTEAVAETVSIANGNHLFLVINRDSNSDRRNPKQWGKDCWICDPWANQYYPADQYRDRLRFLSSEYVSVPSQEGKDEPSTKRIINTAMSLGPKQYFIINPLDSSEWRKRNTLSYLKEMQNIYREKLDYVLAKGKILHDDYFQCTDQEPSIRVADEAKTSMPQVDIEKKSARQLFERFSSRIDELKKDDMIEDIDLQKMTYRELKDNFQEKLSDLKRQYNELEKKCDSIRSLNEKKLSFIKTSRLSCLSFLNTKCTERSEKRDQCYENGSRCVIM